MNATERQAAERLVDRFISAYCAHDLEGITGCFASGATLVDEAWGETFSGIAAIRRHYADEHIASSDIAAKRGATFFGLSSVAVELSVTGTHTGAWRGLPATGNHFEAHVWCVLELSPSGERIVSSRFDYDRATVFSQLGLMHDPDSMLGKALTVLTHPVTMARAARQRISARPPAPTS